MKLTVKGLMGCVLFGSLLVVTLFPHYACASEEKSDESPVVKSSADDREDVSLTIYNSDRALVQEIRHITFPSGLVHLWFQDVPSQIQPETVSIRSLNGGSFTVLEQNYEYDLLSPTKLLEKYLNRDVVLVRRVIKNQSSLEERVTGRLLSTHNGTVWKIGERIVVNPTYDYLEFPDIPPNLYANPTLVWLLETEGKPMRVEASYLTNGISWKADYVFTLDTREDKGQFLGWVTINNRSGATYHRARLKLIAGEVHTVEPERRDRFMVMEKAVQAPPSPFTEKAFFEYHLYTLNRRTTIHDQEQKQIELLDAQGVRAERQYILRGALWYYRQRLGQPQRPSVEVALKLENKKDNGLGIPLPAGIVRVYKRDTDGSAQFIGEDRIEHTPKDEAVFLTIGKAFDIVAERRQTDFQVVGQCVYQSAYEIKIRNHKKDQVTVQVIEPLGGDWTILERSHEFEKLDAFTIRFPVTVEPDQEAVLTYRVQIRVC